MAYKCFDSTQIRPSKRGGLVWVLISLPLGTLPPTLALDEGESMQLATSLAPSMALLDIT